jgi:hypothetical protein
MPQGISSNLAGLLAMLSGNAPESSLTSYGAPRSSVGPDVSDRFARLTNANQAMPDENMSRVAKLNDVLRSDRINSPGRTPSPLLPPPTPIDQWRDFMSMMKSGGAVGPNGSPDRLQQALLDRELTNSTSPRPNPTPPSFNFAGGQYPGTPATPRQPGPFSDNPFTPFTRQPGVPRGY